MEKYKNKVIDKIIYEIERPLDPKDSNVDSFTSNVKMVIEIKILFDVIQIRIVAPNEQIYKTIVAEIANKSNYKRIGTVSEAVHIKRRGWYIAEEDHKYVYQMNMSTIKFGLYNLFEGKNNLIAKAVDSFITKNLEGAKVLSAEHVDIAPTREEIKLFYKDKNVAQQSKFSEMAAETKPIIISEIFPKYRPEYSAEKWKEISQNAYEKKQEFFIKRRLQQAQSKKSTQQSKSNKKEDSCVSAGATNIDSTKPIK